MPSYHTLPATPTDSHHAKVDERIRQFAQAGRLNVEDQVAAAWVAACCRNLAPKMGPRGQTPPRVVSKVPQTVPRVRNLVGKHQTQ